jgi:hypothetical protein
MSEDTGVLRAAKPPVGTGASPLVAQLLALALIALGVLGIEELLSSAGVIDNGSWTLAAVDALDGTAHDAPWVLVVSVVLVIAGLLLLPVVFRRRPRKAVELRASTGVHLRTRDLARVAVAALDGTDTVTDVSVKASRARLRVLVDSVAARDRNKAIDEDIRSRLAPSLGALERPPRLKISVKNEGAS